MKKKVFFIILFIVLFTMIILFFFNKKPITVNKQMLKEENHRALINKSQLLLLDEATSALDNETATFITNNLLEIDNTTKIMITHRLDEEILTKFDEIIVMKNGNIVEFGTYKELMNKNGIFKSLVELV